MNRFNLTFTGETLPGYDPDRVKAAFGDVLSVEDAAQIDQLFSGKTVILRRDLERKEAATLYAQLHKAGADVALKKIKPRGSSYEAWFNVSDDDEPLKSYCYVKRGNVEQLVTTNGRWTGSNPKRPKAEEQSKTELAQES